MEKRKILYVEDQAPMRELMKAALRKEFIVVEAASVEEGLDILRKEAICLVLMDINLPGGMNGIEGTRAIRSTPELQHLPVVVITAYAHDENRRACLEAGCVDFIGKPINVREIGGRLTRILELYGKSEPAPE
ncbi:MAG: response regulator [Chlorobi bacterium]|nr:response regulator [Chlorobiota bacterium]